MAIAVLGAVGLGGYLLLNAQKAAGGAAAATGQGLGGAAASTGQGTGGALASTGQGLGGALASTGQGFGGALGAFAGGIGGFFSGLGTLINPPKAGRTFTDPASGLLSVYQFHDDGLCWLDSQNRDGSWRSQGPLDASNCR